MSWDNIKEFFGSVAPAIGTALGGPAGGAVGALIATALGVDNDAEAVAKALRTDPSLAIKVKELENQALQMHYDAVDKQRQAEITTLKTYIEDTQNARSRQVETEKATGKKDINLYILAYIAVVGFFGIIAMVMLVPLPTGSGELIFFLLGALTANYNSVYNYFFGSSKGSADKTEQLASVAKGKGG